MTRSWLGFITMLMLAIGISAKSADATTIGVLPVGSSYSDVIQSAGPTFSRDYNFTLDASSNGLTILATALGQTSPAYGVDLLEISLYDAANNLIASSSGSPIVFFDSFAQSGIALGAGAYVFSIFGQVTAGKQAFVSISLAANNVVPIPAAGLLMLTALGGLGAVAARRKAKAQAAQTAA
jgi:hypothetical protein